MSENNENRGANEDSARKAFKEKGVEKGTKLYYYGPDIDPLLTAGNPWKVTGFTSDTIMRSPVVEIKSEKNGVSYIGLISSLGKICFLNPPAEDNDEYVAGEMIQKPEK